MNALVSKLCKGLHLFSRRPWGVMWKKLRGAAVTAASRVSWDCMAALSVPYVKLKALACAHPQL